MPSPPFRGEREGTHCGAMGRVRWVSARGSGIPHLTPTLSAPRGGEGAFHIRSTSSLPQQHRAEVAAAEQVQMEMRHVLMGCRAVIGEDAVAGLGDTLLMRDPADRPHESRQLGRRCVRRKIIDRQIFALRDYDDMRGRLRVDVAKGEDMLVLENFVARQFAAQDAGEDIAAVVRHGGSRCHKEEYWLVTRKLPYSPRASFESWSKESSGDRPLCLMFQSVKLSYPLQAVELESQAYSARRERFR